MSLDVLIRSDNNRRLYTRRIEEDRVRTPVSSLRAKRSNPHLGSSAGAWIATALTRLAMTDLERNEAVQIVRGYLWTFLDNPQAAGVEAA